MHSTTYLLHVYKRPAQKQAPVGVTGAYRAGGVSGVSVPLFQLYELLDRRDHNREYCRHTGRHIHVPGTDLRGRKCPGVFSVSRSRL